MATNVRTFDGANDEITLSLGATGFAFGPGTVLGLVTVEAGGTMAVFSAGATNAVSYMLQVDSTTLGVILRLNGVATNGSDIIVSNQWYLVGATKATGTVTPRLHIYDCTAGTWTHENASGTAANSSTPITRSQIGTTPQGGADFDGSMQLVAVWNSVLNDAAFDALTSLQAIISAAPAGLWILDQASTATAVTDYTGNGANQSALIGTTVSSVTIPNFDMTYPSVGAAPFPYVAGGYYPTQG